MHLWDVPSDPESNGLGSPAHNDAAPDPWAVEDDGEELDDSPPPVFEIPVAQPKRRGRPPKYPATFATAAAQTAATQRPAQSDELRLMPFTASRPPSTVDQIREQVRPIGGGIWQKSVISSRRPPET